ncbi:MAG: sigma-70 family RNA polymerase sigma factor [Planctomycetes bacterium]|nr:sigma-70 family RNA polymerase sigma factor [Planctomycetota bacterium]MBI3845550.1 sigma-70 family RNA polymerase sigma factor [Planctomycetota bacterium]
MSKTQRLIESARAGDRAAVDSLYARHQGRLLAFIRMQMSPALARSVAPEDVLQETHLESARKIGEFEPRGPASFYRWLVEIARFKISEAERAQRARKRSLESPLEDDLHASQTSPSGRAMRSECALLVRDAIAALPDGQADAVRLRYLEGLTIAETSQRLARSEAAVKALVSRGLEALARRISDTR